MNTVSVYDALTGVDEKYLIAACDVSAIKHSFTQYRSKKKKWMSTVCCFVLSLIVLLIGSINRFHKISVTVPTETSGADRHTAHADRTTIPDTVSGNEPSETTSMKQSQKQGTDASTEKNTVQTKAVGSTKPITEPSTTSNSDRSTQNDPSNTDVNDPSMSTTETQKPTSKGNDSVIWADENVGTEDSAIINWNEKEIDYSLWTVLQQETDNRTIAITARPIPDETHVYNGKTLAVYAEEAQEEKELTEKLQQLRKLGETLKYGEALYETGTPDGEKWAKELYEEKIRYFGNELLSKYIVDGEFLADQLEADLSQTEKSRTAQDAYDTAYKMCLLESLTQANTTWKNQGYMCETNGNQLILFVTADDFKTIIPPSGCEWFFGLAQRN